MKNIWITILAVDDGIYKKLITIFAIGLELKLISIRNIIKL